MSDILFHSEDYVFSYRVAGILLRDNKILLQKPLNDTGFAIPGGHVEFGEIHAQTLEREFKEEMKADIAVGELKWVAEIFFSWGDKPCHQICLYYDITLKDEKQIPLDGTFTGDECIEKQSSKIEFHWISIDTLEQIEVYPPIISDLIKRYDEGVQKFIYRADEL